MNVEVYGAVLPQDLDAICEIENRCFLGPSAYSSDVLRSLVADPKNACLLARCRGKVAGFVIATCGPKERATIETVDVDPLFRGHGVARRLLLEVEERLSQRGVREVELEVACGNLSALRLYQSVGYVIRAKLVRYYRFLHHGTHDAFRMLKALSPGPRHRS